MNTKDHKVQFSLLQKYFRNKTTKIETDLVTDWLMDPESNYQCENCLHLLWKESIPTEVEVDLDFEALLDRIHHSINLCSRETALSKQLEGNRKSVISFNHVLKHLSRVAAVLLVPLMVYLGWEVYSQRMWEKNQKEIVYNEIQCPLGAQSQFELPDGTKGSLNNGSKLIFPARFTGKSRDVELYGEAFFDVAPNRYRPFIIKTVGLDIKVRGTRLNVYSYPDEDYQEITLESGSVELIQAEMDEEVTIAEMKPGQHLIYRFSSEDPKTQVHSDNKDVIIIEDEEEFEELVPNIPYGKKALFKSDQGDLYLKYDDVNQYTGWKDGKLILRNDPMNRLLKRMERWYSVEFNIMDEQIYNYTYWATFDEENLDQVLNLLSLTGPITFKKLPREQLPDGTYDTQKINVMLK